MKTSTVRVCRLRRHRLGRPQARHLPAGTRLRQASSASCRRASTRGHRRVGRRAARALRRRPHRRVPGDRQGPAGVRPAEARLLGALPGQSHHAGEVPPGLHARAGPRTIPATPSIALELLLDAIREKLKPARATRVAPMRALQRLVERAATLVARRVRITNRLTNALKQYFPQVAGLVSGQGHPGVLRLPDRWPTLQAGPARPPRDPPRLLPRAQRASPTIIERRIQAIRGEPPLTSDAAVIEPAPLAGRGPGASSYAPCPPAIAALRPRDRPSLPTAARLRAVRALPGAGPVFAPRLLAAFGEQRERYRRRSRLPEVRRHRAGHRAQRQQVLGALALRAPSSCARPSSNGPPAPIPHCYWAKRLLRAAARQGRLPQRRPARARLQVDPHRLSLLAGPHALRRSHLPHSPPETPLAPAEIRRRRDAFIIRWRSASGRGLAGTHFVKTDDSVRAVFGSSVW